MKFFIPVVLFSVSTACSSTKKIAYLQDVPDSTHLTPYSVVTSSYRDPEIQPNDIIQVSILTLDPEANSILTASNSGSYSVQSGSSIAGATPPAVAGFLVDKNGMIELPLAGKIKVGGLTTGVAKDSIRSKISKLYKDPVVSVRYANFSISILGEVARPANYIVPNEKISVLDAIGMAGDLTINGRRENILLIRDSSGHKVFARFNFNSSDMVQSPYFYMRQGDVLYVEPSKSKIASSDAARTRNITIGASLISLLIVVFSRL